mgnify:CR=1 FL=1
MLAINGKQQVWWPVSHVPEPAIVQALQELRPSMYQWKEQRPSLQQKLKKHKHKIMKIKFIEENTTIINIIIIIFLLKDKTHGSL